MRTPFKFENIAQVGDRIRAYDFHERTDCYVEGRITAKDTKGRSNPEGFACFVITVDVDGWRGEAKTTGGRVGSVRHIPMESVWEWDGRIVNLSPDHEWFGVLVNGRLSDGWFCDEALTKKLFEERKAEYEDVMLVKVLASKRPWMRKNNGA